MTITVNPGPADGCEIVVGHDEAKMPNVVGGGDGSSSCGANVRQTGKSHTRRKTGKCACVRASERHRVYACACERRLRRQRPENAQRKGSPAVWCLLLVAFGTATARRRTTLTRVPTPNVRARVPNRRSLLAERRAARRQKLAVQYNYIVVHRAAPSIHTVNARDNAIIMQCCCYSIFCRWKFHLLRKYSRKYRQIYDLYTSWTELRGVAGEQRMHLYIAVLRDNKKKLLI